MHRVTEQRWVGFFWFLLTCALLFQLIAFVSPAWLKVFIRFEQEFYEYEITPSDYNLTSKSPLRKHVRPVNQDYSLWYMMQCRTDTWKCRTLSYYQISFMDESLDASKCKYPEDWFLDKTNLFLDGVELSK